MLILNSNSIIQGRGSVAQSEGASEASISCRVKTILYDGFLCRFVLSSSWCMGVESGGMGGRILRSKKISGRCPPSCSKFVHVLDLAILIEVGRYLPYILPPSFYHTSIMGTPNINQISLLKFCKSARQDLQFDAKDKPANRLGLLLYLVLFGNSAEANPKWFENVWKYT